MATPIDIGNAVQEAIDHISLSIQEHVLLHQKAPSIDEATDFTKEAVQHLLDVLVGEKTDLAKHVTISLKPLNDEMTQVAIDIVALTEHGETAVQLLGLKEQVPV
jgi:hypothetical protein